MDAQAVTGFYPLTPTSHPWAVWWSGRAQQDSGGGLCGDAEAQGWCPPEGAVPPRGVHQSQGPAWRQLLHQVRVARGSRDSGPGEGLLVWRLFLVNVSVFLPPSGGAVILTIGGPNRKLMTRCL